MPGTRYLVLDLLLSTGSSFKYMGSSATELGRLASPTRPGHLGLRLCWAGRYSPPQRGEDGQLDTTVPSHAHEDDNTPDTCNLTGTHMTRVGSMSPCCGYLGWAQAWLLASPTRLGLLAGMVWCLLGGCGTYQVRFTGYGLPRGRGVLQLYCGISQRWTTIKPLTTEHGRGHCTMC